MRTQSLFLGAALAASAPALAIEELSKFNPAISVILDGAYYHDTVKGDGIELLEEHSSVLHAAHGEEHEHGDEIVRGFNLRETEIAMSGTVDPYFDAWMTAALGEEGIELEEIWFRTRNLPAGLQLKGGKFFSAIGYHNEKHPHSWEFVDQNLAYLSLIGDHSLAGKGVQLTWLAPTATFFQVGVESLQGDGLERFGAQLDAEDIAAEIAAEFDPNGNGEFSVDELGFRDASGPLLTVAFLRVGPDLGTDYGLQLGVSAARHSRMQGFHEEGADAFVSEGDGDLYGAQAIFKRFPRSAYGQGGVTLQAEYLRFESDQRATFHTDPAELGMPLTLAQDAAYVQASYGIAPRWQVGVRSAAAGISGELVEGGEKEETRISRQHSLAMTWYATEFSRLRLQFNRNDIGTESGREGFNQVMLQYNLSLGAHGAHSF